MKHRAYTYITKTEEGIFNRIADGKSGTNGKPRTHHRWSQTDKYYNPRYNKKAKHKHKHKRKMFNPQNKLMAQLGRMAAKRNISLPQMIKIREDKLEESRRKKEAWKNSPEGKAKIAFQKLSYKDAQKVQLEYAAKLDRQIEADSNK